MHGISTSVAVLLITGIPQGVLSPLALHLFTRTKIEIKKYLFLSFIFIITTYLIRFLPITLGVNTVLSLLVLILSFQLAYKSQITKLVSSVISSIIIVLLIAISEILNMLLLMMLYGQTRAEELFVSSVGITQSISTIPSTVFFAIFIIIGYFLLKGIDKRKQKNGKTGKETCE